MTALKTADESAFMDLHTHLLDVRTCRQDMGPTHITCAHPGFGVGSAEFQTYPSLMALYDAYLKRIRSLSPQVRLNSNDCTRFSSEGEVSWNHAFQHLTRFTLPQVRDDGLDPYSQAAGRVFCTYNGSSLTMVWTQNAGALLAEIDGTGTDGLGFQHEDTYTWWRNIHHRVPGMSAGMHGSPTMQMTH